MMDRVREFYAKPHLIPSLAGVLHSRQLTGSMADAMKTRKMRSERREGCLDMLGAILHYCDLPTMCLSVPQGDGSMRPVTMKTLRGKAGLRKRRAERAIRDIVEAGLLKVHYRSEEKPDGTYIGHAAIRVVPMSLFGMFGLEERLKHDRRKLSKRRREGGDLPKQTRTAKARVRVTVQAAMDTVLNKKRAPERPQAANVMPKDFTEIEPRGEKTPEGLRGVKSLLSSCFGKTTKPDDKQTEATPDQQGTGPAHREHDPP